MVNNNLCNVFNVFQCFKSENKTFKTLKIFFSFSRKTLAYDSTTRFARWNKCCSAFHRVHSASKHHHIESLQRFLLDKFFITIFREDAKSEEEKQLFCQKWHFFLYKNLSYLSANRTSQAIIRWKINRIRSIQVQINEESNKHVHIKKSTLMLQEIVHLLLLSIKSVISVQVVEKR